MSLLRLALSTLHSWSPSSKYDGARQQTARPIRPLPKRRRVARSQEPRGVKRRKTSMGDAGPSDDQIRQDSKKECGQEIPVYKGGRLIQLAVPTSDSISAPTITTMPLFGDGAVPWQLESGSKARRRRCTGRLARRRDKTLHEADDGQWTNFNVGFSLSKVCRHGLKSRKGKPSKDIDCG